MQELCLAGVKAGSTLQEIICFCKKIAKESAVILRSSSWCEKKLIK